ncbi:MAG: 30S ribosomal protein S16 [Gracilimonas sp.]
MLRIRLQRKGRKKRPIWHIVVAESHEARDGRIVEQVGRYDNVTEKKEVILNEDRIFYWLDSGAQPSDTVRKILRREGLLYKRHLMNWGKSEEEIEKALSEWGEYRDSKKEDSASRKEDYKAVLAAEEKEYKEQLQKKAKQAAAEVEAEKAAAEAEKKEDDAPKSDADKIEDALKEAESDTAEESVEETAAAEEAAVEETQEESAEKPVAEAEAAPEVVEEEDVAAPEEPTAKEAAEAVEENVAEATEEPEVEDAKEEVEEETKDEAPAKEDAEEEKEEKTSGQVSTDMTAKEAIDHINDTDLENLKGFVPDDEDRVTVQRAWESKQEG